MSQFMNHFCHACRLVNVTVIIAVIEANPQYENYFWALHIIFISILLKNRIKRYFSLNVC